MQPKQLRDRFRIDVDDIDPDPEADDKSGLLWSDADILFYMDQTQRQFIKRTKYIHTILRLPVVAETNFITLPKRFNELRGRKAFLENARTSLVERSLMEVHGVEDDYGTPIELDPLSPQRSGRPRTFSLDLNIRQLTLFPTPNQSDVLRLPAYIGAEPLTDYSCEFTIREEDHIVMLLDGMKAMAYRKQDADAYDPNQAERWEKLFNDNVEEVRWELARRRRKPGQVMYGGL